MAAFDGPRVCFTAMTKQMQAYWFNQLPTTVILSLAAF